MKSSGNVYAFVYALLIQVLELLTSKCDDLRTDGAPSGGRTHTGRNELDYFFLYPAGHLGLTAVTFLVTLPLMQVIEIDLILKSKLKGSKRVID